MSYVKDIFGSSADSDVSFKGFSVTEMTKTKKASSGKQPQKQSVAGFFPEQAPEQVPTEPRAERATSQDGGNADDGPDRSTHWKSKSKPYDGLLMVFCWFVKSSGFENQNFWQTIIWFLWKWDGFLQVFN